MFSMYKNIISKNMMCAQGDYLDQRAIQETIYGFAKLIQCPRLPQIDEPKVGDDSLFCPFDTTYVEGSVEIHNFDLEQMKPESKNLGYVTRGAFLLSQLYEDVPSDTPKPPATVDVDKIHRFILADMYETNLDSSIPHHVPMTLLFWISKEGNLLECSHIDRVDRQITTEEEKKYADIHLRSWYVWILSFLRFINLPNIVMENEPFSSGEIKHFKRQKSNQKCYRILKVKKPSFSKKSLDSAHETTPMPLHQVRGHLADYTEGKGLFGKYNIRIWVPDHWRGNLDYGETKKDYELIKNN